MELNSVFAKRSRNVSANLSRLDSCSVVRDRIRSLIELCWRKLTIKDCSEVEFKLAKTLSFLMRSLAESTVGSNDGSESVVLKRIALFVVDGVYDLDGIEVVDGFGSVDGVNGIFSG